MLWKAIYLKVIHNFHYLCRIVSLQIRKLNSVDYDTILTKWWKDWRWTAPSKELLPDNGEGGFIVYDGDVPVCAGFIYNTNSGIAWCEFVVSNFDYKDKKKKKECLQLLISSISNMAKSMGKKFMYSLLKSKTLIDIYEEDGYVTNPQSYTEMIKII